MKLFLSILLIFAFLLGSAQSAQDLYDDAMQKVKDGATVTEVFNVLDRCLSEDSTLEDAYFLKAFVHYKLEEFDAAIDVYDDLLEINPYNREALKRRALTKIQVYNLDGAIKDHNKRLVLEPMNAVIYFDRAYCKGLQNDIIGSIEDYTRALELDPYFKEAYANRGVAKMNLIAHAEEVPKMITKENICRDITTARSLGDPYADKIYAEYCTENAKD